MLTRAETTLSMTLGMKNGETARGPRSASALG